MIGDRELKPGSAHSAMAASASAASKSPESTIPSRSCSSERRQISPARLAATPHRRPSAAAAVGQPGILQVAGHAAAVARVVAVALGDDGVVGLDDPLEARARLRAHAWIRHRGA
jgi:hypothetical protein